MIEGVVNSAYEAVVTLPLRGPEGQSRKIDAVIDTGYNGFLTLPTDVVAELGLAFGGISRATLADGSVVAFDVYDVMVIWDGIARYLAVQDFDKSPALDLKNAEAYSYRELAHKGKGDLDLALQDFGIGIGPGRHQFLFPPQPCVGVYVKVDKCRVRSDLCQE